MKVIAITNFGSAPEQIDVYIPEPEAGDILVRVHAASINGFDLAVANGYTKGMMEHRFPVVLGKDFAGIIESVGEGVQEFAPGDRVFGVVTRQYLGDGSLGEFVCVPTSIGTARLPETIDFTIGGALGLAGTAAYDAVRAAEVDGKTVLIVGATGGVGSMAVQRAVASGAHVIATASSDEEREFVIGLGAHQTVDYKGDTTAETLKLHPGGIDAVLHFAGDPAALLAVLKSGGRFVSTLIMSADQLEAPDAVVVPVYATPTSETLTTLAADVVSGKTTVPISWTFPLNDAIKALETFAQGKVGKIAVSMS